MLPPDEARRALFIALQLLTRHSAPRTLPAAVAGPAIVRRHFNSTPSTHDVALVPLDKAPGSGMEAVMLTIKDQKIASAKKDRRIAMRKAARAAAVAKKATSSGTEAAAEAPVTKRAAKAKAATEKPVVAAAVDASKAKQAEKAEIAARRPVVANIKVSVDSLTPEEKDAGVKAVQAIYSDGKRGSKIRAGAERKKLYIANMAGPRPKPMARHQFIALCRAKTDAQLSYGWRVQLKTIVAQPGKPLSAVVTSALLKLRAEDETYQMAKKEGWVAEKQRRDGEQETKSTSTIVFDYPQASEARLKAAMSTIKSLRSQLQDLSEHRRIMVEEQSKNAEGAEAVESKVAASSGEPPEEPNEEDDLSEEEPELLYQKPPHFEEWAVDSGSSSIRTQVAARGIIKANDVKLTAEIPDRHMIVARLRSNLTGVPFSPGVHWMQDPRTGVFNFDPAELQQIPRPEEFAYDRVAPYSKPSTHSELAQLAQKTSCTYAGSTSTLTKAFSQIYFLISRNRPVKLNSFSGAFNEERSDFTFGCQLPACLEVTKNEETGIWYVDNDKSADAENVLSEYGVIMEKMLTLEPKEFAKLLNANEGDSDAQKAEISTEAFYYQHGAKLMMRSQLDCYDPRLPGTGVFDIKTRACLPIRHDRANWVANSVYEITEEKGYIRSFEREDYDMLRATMLKYSMQARIGAMDGIFVAYHNTAKIFGFRYLPITEIDEQLFGSTELAESAFKLCVALFEGLMDEITTCFPGEKRLNVVIKHFNGSSDSPGTLAAFVQPKTSGPSTAPVKGIYLSVENSIDGEKVDGVVDLSADDAKRKTQEWSVEYQISTSSDDPTTQDKVLDKLASARSEQIRMLSIAHPEGKTPKQMKALDLEKYGPKTNEDSPARPVWTAPNTRQLMLRKESKDSARDHAERMKGWKEGHDTGLSWIPVPSPEVTKAPQDTTT